MQSTLAVNGGAPVRSKPFPGWPVFDEREEQALLRVLHSGKWWQFGYGYGVELEEDKVGPRAEVSYFQEEFAAMHGCKHGVAACNGTATLEIALRAMDIGPGDEVIVPAYSFIASASCILQVGAVPVFVDVEPGTLNIDPTRIEEAVTPRTRAIIPVHFAGQSADMDAIGILARKHNLFILEDAAHAHGASWKHQPCGSLGDVGSFSFQNSKNMTAGEGGIITTNNDELADLCRSYLWAGREKGQPWYEHHRLGSNYRMTEFQAALLRVQLLRLEEQTTRRNANGRYLNTQLSTRVHGITPLAVDKRATRHAFHVYILRYDASAFDGVTRECFLSALNAEGIPCMGGYTHPLYQNPMFINKDFWKGGFPFNSAYAKPVEYSDYAAQCPVAEAACNETVWLPQNILLGEKPDLDDVATAVEKIQNSLVA